MQPYSLRAGIPPAKNIYSPEVLFFDAFKNAFDVFKYIVNISYFFVLGPQNAADDRQHWSAEPIGSQPNNCYS
jgi:hypothetical protein